MSCKPINVSLRSALEMVTKNKPFTEVFSDGDLISVEFYSPHEWDKQSPHDRDELYVVVEGTGIFSRGDERFSFGPGDLIYVPAHLKHRFESFSPGFCVWVIFYGVPK